MSPVRTHFWTLVARLYGAGASPRKYGLNGTMPALTNSRLGSSSSREALGTTVWPARSKCSRKRLMISWVCTGTSFRGIAVGGARRGGRRSGSAVRPTRSRAGAPPRGGLGRVPAGGEPGLPLDGLLELLLALGHARAHLGPEGAQRARQLAQP